MAKKKTKGSIESISLLDMEGRQSISDSSVDLYNDMISLLNKANVGDSLVSIAMVIRNMSDHIGDDVPYLLEYIQAVAIGLETMKKD